MKKLVVLLLVLIVSTAVYAEIDLGNFALGTWLDANYDAYWHVTSGTIQIQNAQGNIYIDFDEATLEDFSIRPSTSGIEVSFYCVETEKTYTLIQPLTSRDITLRIERSGLDDYEIVMPRQ